MLNPPAASRSEKGGPNAQALGRSRGGFGTKIHVCLDALGLPIRILLGPGQWTIFNGRMTTVTEAGRKETMRAQGAAFFRDGSRSAGGPTGANRGKPAQGGGDAPSGGTGQGAT